METLNIILEKKDNLLSLMLFCKYCTIINGQFKPQLNIINNIISIFWDLLGSDQQLYIILKPTSLQDTYDN